MKNNKSLGQHWLKNREILDEIAFLSLPEGKEADLCVEIGPGLGTLTSSLLKNYPEVVAVEYDENLAHNLPKSFPGKNLQVFNEDILKFDFNTIKIPFTVAGNIPYYITSPIIQKLLYLNPQPLQIALLIQKEVAERIAAGAGDHTVLSLTVQNRAEVALGPVVKKDQFTPPPKVDSRVIVLTPKKPTVSENVIELAKIGFKNPRKKLTANLSSFGLKKDELASLLEKNGINPSARPAELKLKDWEILAKNLHKR